MHPSYPTYNYTEADAKYQLARIVRLDNPDSYPFDNFHAHAYNVIMYFTEGGGHHNINFQNHEVQDHAIHLIAANDLHWLERSMQSSGFAIVYKDPFIHKLQFVHPELNFTACLSQSAVINLDATDQSQFAFLIDELQKESTTGPYLLQIIGAFITKIVSMHTDNSNQVGVHDPIVHEVVALIETHFKTLKTNQAYAQLLHVYVRTLHNRLQKSIGISLNQLLQDRILKEAKKMILLSNYNITEIAYELGFQDAAHFTHWLKKQSGYLPTAYKYGR